MQLLENSHFESCCICNQINGRESNDLIHKMIAEGTYVRRVILENANFAVIPSLGALVEGHVIICPKQHVKSLAQLDCNVYSCLEDVKQKITFLLKKTYNKNVHFFEHGSAKGDGRLVCTVDHAHLHALPTEVHIGDLINTKYKWNTFHSSHSELKGIVKDNEYLYYETPAGNAFISSTNEAEFESQYLRKVFAKALGKFNEWNWREFPNPDLTNEIYLTLHDRHI